MMLGMSNSLNFRDLLIRVFVIAIASLVFTLSTKNNQFDLHFKIRKAQRTSDQVLIIEIASADQIVQLIKSLQGKNVKHIFVSDFTYEHASPVITPYSTMDKNPYYLSVDLKPDSDGIVRRVRLLTNPIQFIKNPPNNEALTINFRGPRSTFQSVNFYDISETNLNLDGKIVIVSSNESLNDYTTPVGLIGETEMIATILDNFIENRFIPNAQISYQILILIGILIVITAFLLYLPSTLGLLASTIFAILYICISLWVFDTYYIWTPILNPVFQILLTFLLISNYKFVLNEKTKWNLERDAQYSHEVEEMKANFLSLFSHDLKTPLSKILGISETLLNEVKDSKIHAELEKIKSSSRDLEKYIKRILKLSQVQSKNVSLNRSPEDINHLIEKSIEQNKFLAHEKNIRIIKKLNPLFMIDIDGPLIEEVIINFIENAITYSPKEGEIVITSEEFKNHIKVSIKDNGRGIPKEAHESIWEKYYRFDTTEPGYGLGLYLSRYVINLHGGQVYLNSKENLGSEFGFILPIGEV